MNIRWCILFTSLQFTECSLFSLLLLVFCKRLHVADELKCYVCVFFFLFCFQFIIPVQRQIHHKQIYNLCVKNNNNNQCFDEMNSKKNKTLRHIHRNQTKPISFMYANEGKPQLCVTKLCESSTYKL